MKTIIREYTRSSFCRQEFVINQEMVDYFNNYIKEANGKLVTEDMIAEAINHNPEAGCRSEIDFNYVFKHTYGDKTSYYVSTFYDEIDEALYTYMWDNESDLDEIDGEEETTFLGVEGDNE